MTVSLLEQTDVVRKFIGITCIGIYPSAIGFTELMELDYVGSRGQIVLRV